MPEDQLRTINRIDQLNIPNEFKPILRSAAWYVLNHPDRIDTAARKLNAEIAKSDQPRAAFLHYSITPDGGPAPEQFDGCHDLWQAYVMLLATLAIYPGDLSRFGVCGKIPWQTKLVRVGRKADQLDFALGRDWMLFDVGGQNPHDDMLDRSGESIATHYGELIDGKVQNYVKRTPWEVRGALGRLVDRLTPILRELGIDAPPVPKSPASELAARLQQLHDDIGSRRSMSQPLRQNAADLLAQAGKLLKGIRKNRRQTIDDRRLLAHLQEALTALSDLQHNRQVQDSSMRLRDAAKGITTSTSEPTQLPANGEHRARAPLAEVAARTANAEQAEQPASQPRLNETDKKAAKYIRDNPKCKGDAVAAEIAVTPEHFRSRIFPKLSKHGFYNRGDGYCPPKRARKAVM